MNKPSHILSLVFVYDNGIHWISQHGKASRNLPSKYVRSNYAITTRDSLQDGFTFVRARAFLITLTLPRFITICLLNDVLNVHLVRLRHCVGWSNWLSKKTCVNAYMKGQIGEIGSPLDAPQS